MPVAQSTVTSIADKQRRAFNVFGMVERLWGIRATLGRHS